MKKSSMPSCEINEIKIETKKVEKFDDKKL